MKKIHFGQSLPPPTDNHNIFFRTTIRFFPDNHKIFSRTTIRFLSRQPSDLFLDDHKVETIRSDDHKVETISSSDNHKIYHLMIVRTYDWDVDDCPMDDRLLSDNATILYCSMAHGHSIYGLTDPILKMLKEQGKEAEKMKVENRETVERVKEQTSFPLKTLLGCAAQILFLKVTIDSVFPL